MSSRESEIGSKNYRDHLKIIGMIGAVWGVTDAVGLNSETQANLAKTMEKPGIESVTHANKIISEASDDLFVTGNMGIFKEPAVKEAAKVINKKNEFYDKTWEGIREDHGSRVVFDIMLVAGGLALRNRVKKQEKESVL